LIGIILKKKEERKEKKEEKEKEKFLLPRRGSARDIERWIIDESALIRADGVSQ